MPTRDKCYTKRMRIYFSGIGGVGIGPLAEIARDAGYDILGSDTEDGLMTAELAREGVRVVTGPQDGAFLRESHAKQPIDWFVHTAALKTDHAELLAAKELGIKTAKRDEFLVYFIKEKNLKLVAITGTHGKTTTTGMVIWTLQQLGVPVSYAIGTTISFGSSGHFDPSSEYFVYECDEFDRNFLKFAPHLAIIPSLDYDHPDTYPSEQEYLDAFRQFATQSEQVLTWSDQHPEVFEGLFQVSQINPSEINHDLKLHGLHNLRNATLTQVAVKRLGIDGETEGILSNFPGTDRRFEKLADNLYSDYGHHPVEIAATLQLAREISDKVVLVYQPHQNIRQHKIKNDYTNQFELAEEIYWLPTYLSREDTSLPILEPQELIQNITNKDDVHVADFDDRLWDNIQSALSQGKLVVCMGAGAIDQWVRDRLHENS